MLCLAVAGLVRLEIFFRLLHVLYPRLPGRDELFPGCRLFGGLGERFIYFPGLIGPGKCFLDIAELVFDPLVRQPWNEEASGRRLDRSLGLADDQQALDTRQTNPGDLLLKSHELVDAVVTEDTHGCRNNGYQTEAGDDFLS